MLVKLALRMTSREVQWENGTKEFAVCTAEPEEPSLPFISPLSS